MKAVATCALFIMLVIQNIYGAITIQRGFLVIEGEAGKSTEGAKCKVPIDLFFKALFYDEDRKFQITWTPKAPVNGISPNPEVQSIEIGNISGITYDDGELITGENDYAGSFPNNAVDAVSKDYPITCTQAPKAAEAQELRSVL